MYNNEPLLYLPALATRRAIGDTLTRSSSPFDYELVFLLFLDAIAFPSTYPRQSVGQWVSEWVIVSDLEIAIASPNFASLFYYRIEDWGTHCVIHSLILPCRCWLPICWSRSWTQSLCNWSTREGFNLQCIQIALIRICQLFPQYF